MKWLGERIVTVAAEALTRLTAADTASVDVEAEEIIRQIFSCKSAQGLAK